jgi:hypothetical protein
MALGWVQAIHILNNAKWACWKFESEFISTLAIL